MGLIVHHGLYGAEVDETAAFAGWHIPASHYLEMWGDLRGHDGTASIIQPLIDPLYTTKSDVELLAFLAGQGRPRPTTWSRRRGRDLRPRPPTPPTRSRRTGRSRSRRGVFLGSGLRAAGRHAEGEAGRPGPAAAATRPSTAGWELCFRPDPSVWDGRFANLAWLQELPKPVSLLTWDTAAFMSWNTAKQLGVDNADQGRGLETQIVKVTYQGRDLAVPALVMPGHAEDSITIYLGYGRVRGGHVTQQASGSDAFYLLPTGGEFVASGVECSRRTSRTCWPPPRATT